MEELQARIASELAEVIELSADYRDKGLLAKHREAETMVASLRDTQARLNATVPTKRAVYPRHQPLELGDTEFGGAVVVTVELPACTAAALVAADLLPSGRAVVVDASGAGYDPITVDLGCEVAEPAPGLGGGGKAVFSKRTRVLELRFRPLPLEQRRSRSAKRHARPAGDAPLDLDRIAQDLAMQHYAVVDGFLGAPHASALAAEARGLRDDGTLSAGEVEGGLRPRLRGDLMAWVPASSKPALAASAAALDALLLSLTDRLPELQTSELLRDKAMVTCYPGGGARYVRHCDNVNAANRSRVLTAITYLNPGWAKTDGGSLRLYVRPLAPTLPQPDAVINGGSGMTPLFGDPDDSEPPRPLPRGPETAVDVAPLMDRLVLFWSDGRVPHEVLPTADGKDRFAVSFWFHDGSKIAPEPGDDLPPGAPASLADE